ncbi:MAG TPA: histidine kinase [Mycobacterium sp.]|nr:histidine kinase [Mycobacterium sp.]
MAEAAFDAREAAGSESVGGRSDEDLRGAGSTSPRRAAAVTAQVQVENDRDRIAASMHDHVIQKLFAIGMRLETLSDSLPSTQHAADGHQLANALDEVITLIRAEIYDLHGASGVPADLRQRVAEVVADYPPGPSPSLELTLSGRPDRITDEALIDDACAALREGISNALRHAHARRIELAVAVDEDTVRVEVDDDGIGLVRIERTSGLANLDTRATSRGGRLALSLGHTGRGIHLLWAVPA